MTFVLKLLQQALPKPLLFGLYGASGSLVGALLLGEILWAFLVPPPPQRPATPLPPPPPPSAIRIAVSEAMSINQGDANQFVVKIARDNFAGAVTIEFGTMPAGLSAKTREIPNGVDEVELEVTAQRDAEVGNQPLKVKAVGPGVEEESSISVTVVRVDPPPPVQIDIVFVLDVTNSMGFAKDGILRGIGDFAKELESSELDIRLALLAFRDLFVDQPSRVLKFEEGNIFTLNYEAFRRELGTVRLGGGLGDRNFDLPESSLDALAEAARLPFRAEATKVLLLITDALPQIPDKTIKTLAACGDILKLKEISQVHLVVRPEHHQTYALLQEGRSGEYFDLMEAAGGSAGFAKILPSVSSAIAKIAIQNRPEAPGALPLAKPTPPPALPAIEVPKIKAVQSTQEYSSDSKWQLIVAIAVWTSVSAMGISLTLLAGQQFYLRQSLLGLAAIAKGMAVGLSAGLAGGAIGQILYGMLPPTTLLDAAFRAFGWSLLGATVAYGISFSVPNLRWDKALIGGAFGGIAGAFGFMSANFLLPNAGGDIGGRLVGATLLGFFLGLMVAWAESAFRRAWLEIRYGAREIRRVNLGPEPVSLGSSSGLCTIYVPGSAPIALRYRLDQSSVIKETVPIGAVEEVRDGNRQTLGSIEITVRTSSDSSKSSAPSPTVALPPAPKATKPNSIPPKKTSQNPSIHSGIPSPPTSSKTVVPLPTAPPPRPPVVLPPASKSSLAPNSAIPRAPSATSSPPKESSATTEKRPLPPLPPPPTRKP